MCSANEMVARTKPSKKNKKNSTDERRTSFPKLKKIRHRSGRAKRERRFFMPRLAIANFLHFLAYAHDGHRSCAVRVRFKQTATRLFTSTEALLEHKKQMVRKKRASQPIQISLSIN